MSTRRDGKTVETSTFPLASPASAMHYPPREWFDIHLWTDVGQGVAMRGPRRDTPADIASAMQQRNRETVLRNLLFGGVMAVLCGCAPAPAKPDAMTGSPATVGPGADQDGELVRIDLESLLEKNQRVVVDNPYGDVRLRFGGYENRIEIHAVAQQPTGAAPIALTPGAVDGSYRIAPRLPADSLAANGQRMDLVVFLPQGHAVDVRTEQGLIESRGIRGDVTLNSTSGDIALRGTQGAIQARTGAGSIEASLLKAPRNSRQTFATSTGTILLAVNDKLDAHLELSTSAAFATEYSLKVEQLTGKEPNKRALAVVGDDEAGIVVTSLRGEIRLLRWRDFSLPDGRHVDDDDAIDNDSD